METQGDETISVELNIVEGKTCPALSDAEREEIAEAPSLMGRSSRMDKFGQEYLRRNLGHEVVTEDGTNDAPSLHEGDIGLAMGIHGTEFAKENSYALFHEDGKVLCPGYANIRRITKRANRESDLPSSSKDLANTPLRKKAALTFKAFLYLAFWSVYDIPPQYHGFLLLICSGFLSYQVNNSTAPFDFEFGKPINTPQTLLSFGDACFASLPEMAHITKFMLSYFMTVMLILPLRPGLQIFFVLLLISTPLFYFPELIRKASGVNVAFGSFKPPLILFAALGALCLSLTCGLVTLLVFYLFLRSKHEGKPKDITFNLDSLSSVILAG